MRLRMPQPPPSPQERRLTSFSRFSAGVYFLGAAILPFALRAEPLAGALAAALLASLATSCLVAAARPRERRHALLPVVVALAAVCLTAIVLRLWNVYGFIPAPLLLIATLFIYNSAAPGVRSAPALEGPPPAPEEPADRKIQLGIKSN
jgi:hypothetical protein